jgi:hypothetical protein
MSTEHITTEGDTGSAPVSSSSQVITIALRPRLQSGEAMISLTVAPTAEVGQAGGGQVGGELGVGDHVGQRALGTREVDEWVVLGGVRGVAVGWPLVGVGPVRVGAAGDEVPGAGVGGRLWK